MKIKRTERGQAIVLIALAIVGLVGLSGLSVDMGVTYANRRQAQNAADNAALSTALLAIRDEGATQGELESNAEDIMRANGLNPDDGTVTITVNRPPADGPYADCSSSDFDCNEYIQIIINTEVSTYFAPVVGIQTTHNTVEAVARAKPPQDVIPFDGAAVVGLSSETDDKSQCPIDSGNTDWTVTGGGLFANGCAFKKSSGDMDIPNDKCVTSVAGSSGFSDVGCVQQNQNSMYYSAEEIAAIYPPAPACDDTAEGGYTTLPSDFIFEDGVYCISDFDMFEDEHTVLNNATLYVNDSDASFNIKFNGNKGSFSGSASTSGTYKGYYLIVASGAPGNCTAYNKGNQILVLRGNGNISITGTIFAPTTCIDLRGNSGEEALDSQIIGWKVSSNSSAASVSVAFNPDNNAQVAIPPLIELSQ